MNLTTQTYDADLYQLVPREPTKEMKHAAWDYFEKNNNGDWSTVRASDPDVGITYREMLAAAPQPPETT